jgi:hypothetical protein
MKINSIINKIALAISFACFYSGASTAQDKSPAMNKSEATIALSYNKNADLRKTAMATVKAKNKDGKFVPAKNAQVNFYTVRGTEQQLLSKAVTNNKGQAAVVLQKDLPLDDSLCFTVVVKIEGDPMYEDASEQMRYKDASLALSLNPHDTSRIATVKITTAGKDGKDIPANDVAVKFYVQRLFGSMPASEEYTVNTDEKGEATFAYPKNISGDTAGIYTAVVRIEDNDKFGNVENKANTIWGKELAVIKDPFPRALWEPYAPLPLVITISTLFGGVWFTYFFIFFQLRKIKTENSIV